MKAVQTMKQIANKETSAGSTSANSTSANSTSANSTSTSSTASKKGVNPRLDAELSYLRRQVKQQQETIKMLQRHATEDSLTELYNRRYFEEALIRAMSHHERYGHGGAVLLVDINHFKSINDTLGHQAGDAILVHIAKILLAHTRESDVVARLGGDEFCIILNEVSKREAMAKAVEIDAVIAAYPCNYNGKDIQSTVSIGMCAFTDAKTESEVVQKADRAMYKDKQDKHSNVVRFNTNPLL